MEITPNSLRVDARLVTIDCMKGGRSIAAVPPFFVFQMLNDLQRLSAATHAKVNLVIEDGYACVRVKAPGRSAEVIHDRPAFGAATPIDTIVAQLLTRFGFEPRSQSEFIRLVKQRPAKLARLKALLSEIRELKREVFMPIEQVEPCLASPRSSLNPQFMEAEHE